MLLGFASGRKHDRVPWKQIKEHTGSFIQPDYLPEPTDGVTQLEDPSDMKKEQIARLLEHWSRPVPGSDIFRFSVVLVNNKTDETMAALYKDPFTTVFSNPIDNTLHQLPPLGDTPTDSASDVVRPWSPQIDPALLDGPTDLAIQREEPIDDDPVDQTIQTQPPTPAIDLIPPIPPTPNPSGEPIDQLGSSVDATALSLTNGQEPSRPIRPKPKARRKPNKPSTQDPNPSPIPISQQEEDLGRPKRITKRKINVYLEAEEKDAQKKKQKRK